VRERLTTLGLALAALLLFLTLFVRGGGFDSRTVSAPTSLERGENGLLGAMSWLHEEGVRTVSLRERFGSLAKRHDLAAGGNLLIVTLPAVTSFRNDEAVALDQWIRNGNTLLVLAAISDRPAWARERNVLEKDLQLLTGVELELVRARDHSRAKPEPQPPRSGTGKGNAAPTQEHVSESAGERIVEAAQVLAKPQRGTLVLNRPHRFLDNVQAAYAFSDYLPRAWNVKVPRDGFLLSLAHVRESGEGVLWVLPDGPGTVILSGFGSVFSNRALGQGDNARLLANIVAAAVAPEGAVLFDDEHQGLSATYDPAKFYRDRRLYATLGCLALVWLVWVVGGTKLRMPPPRAPAPREEDLVRTTGTFLARVLRPAAAARRMFELFFLRMRAGRRSGLELASPWDWLEHHPRVARSDLAQLKEWYAQAYSDRRVPLTRLHNLIVKTERQLAA
jgi:hypothetical protein